MLDPGVLQLIEGVDIDLSYNALLTGDLHRRVGELHGHVPSSKPDAGAPSTYLPGLETLEYPFFEPNLPPTQSLFTTPDRIFDPPPLYFPATHRALCVNALPEWRRRTRNQGHS